MKNKISVQVKILSDHLLETLTLPILTWPFLDTILFLSFSWWGSKLRKCFPASSLRTISPSPSPILDLADSLLPLIELLQENSDSAWPSSGLATLICLIPPFPSSTVTSVGLSQKSSSPSSMSESNTSSEVLAASVLPLSDELHLCHQPGITLTHQITVDNVLQFLQSNTRSRSCGSHFSVPCSTCETSASAPQILVFFRKHWEFRELIIIFFWSSEILK